MARFVSPDPLRGDVLQPQSFNLYAYMRGNPGNAVDPDGMAVVLKFAMPGDRVRFLHQLRWITGLNLGLNADGSLVIRGVLKDGAGKLLGSEKARELLNAAISSDKTYLVTLVRDLDVFGGRWTSEDRTIALDPGDFEKLDYGANRRMTLDVGMAFFHELGHAMLGYHDLPWLAKEQHMPSSWEWKKMYGPGPVVELVNSIRSELGLPLRIYYTTGTPTCPSDKCPFVMFSQGPIWLR